MGRHSKLPIRVNTYILTYDAENRLSSANYDIYTSASLAYDADGARVKRTVNGLTTVYLGNLQEMTFAYQDDFNDGLAQGWTAASGTWAVSANTYRQSQSISGTNAYHFVSQNGPLMVQWQVKYNTGTSASFYFYASAPTGEGRGNAYYVKQDAGSVYLYKSVNNVLTQQGVGAAANAAGQTHSYAVSYNPTTGLVQVSRDGTSVVSWTDPSPLTTGSYLSLRTDYTDASFDEVAVYTKNKYYYAGQQRIAVRATGTLYFLLTDHLGSTAVTVDANGVKQGELRYYPYGDVRYTWGTTPTDRQYTGQVLDWDTNLLYYGARYYAYGLGRFTQPDTVVPSPGNPQDLNRYTYARNNPLLYTDPSGHAACIDANCNLLENPATGNVMVGGGSNLYSLIAHVAIGGSTAIGRLDQILAETVGRVDRDNIIDNTFGGIIHSQFRGFGNMRGDASFATEFRDDHWYAELWGAQHLPETRQVGHFLTAVSMGYTRYPRLVGGLLKRAIVGHEQLSDNTGFIQQTWHAKSVEKFDDAVAADAGGGINGREAALRVIFDLGTGTPEQRVGNSMEDLRLSVRGWQLGRMVRSGEIQTNRELANWTALNIAGD